MNVAAPPAFAAAPSSDTEEEVEELIVESTRSGRRVQDEPIRVDILSRE